MSRKKIRQALSRPANSGPPYCSTRKRAAILTIVRLLARQAAAETRQRLKAAPSCHEEPGS